MNCIASRTALIVIMPPNPVFARLLSTVTVPFLTHVDAWVPLCCRWVQSATGKSWKSTLCATQALRPIDELCGNVRRCAGRVRASHMQGELSVEGSQGVALLVREELARRRLSRQWLADGGRGRLSPPGRGAPRARALTPGTV